MKLLHLFALSALFLSGGFCLADDPVFSGPQIGEPLVPFQVLSVYGDDAGKEVDPVAQAEGKPLLFVFVHKKTRPGLALTRGLTNYAKSLPGAAAAIIWLDDDKAKAENYLTVQAKNALQLGVPVGISVDGGEGPGAYGLNRNVELTVLVANENKVAANFALVQPSVTEGPAIVAELAKLVGKKAPSTDEFQKVAFPGRGQMAAKNARNMRRKPAETAPGENPLRELMRKVIAADISESDLRSGIEAIDKWAGENQERRKQLGRMAGNVLQRSMGSPAAQKQIKIWHEKYGPSDE